MGAQIKKSPGPTWNPEDCTRIVILAYSPAHEGIKGLSLGRSSGLWFVLLPAPSRSPR